MLNNTLQFNKEEILSDHPSNKSRNKSASQGTPAQWAKLPLHRIVLSHNAGVYKSQSLYGQGTNIVGVADIYNISKIDGQTFSLVPLSIEEQKIFAS